MSLKMKATSSSELYPQPEPGNQAAVLVAIVDLGTVEKEYKGDKYKARELYLCWELPTQPMPDSQHNHVVGRCYSASFGTRSNLRQLVSQWIRPIKDGEEVDLAKLLGQQCLLNVQAVEGKSYVKLDPLCATKLPKGMACPPAKHKPVLWEIEGSSQLPEHLDWLPFIYGESVQDRIKRSDEWKAKLSQSGDEQEIPAGDDGDMPF